MYQNIKKSFFTAALICLSMTCLAAKNGLRGDDNYHFMWVSMSGGYSALNEHVSSISTKGDFGGFVGIGYEFRRSHFWISVGGQLQMHRSSMTCEDRPFNKTSDNWPTTSLGQPMHALDDQDPAKQFDPLYYVSQTDDNKWNTIDVPLMMGYYNQGFYFGLGAKVGFSFMSKISTTGTYSLMADYDRYVGVFDDMPEHFFTKYDYSGTQNVNLYTQCSLLGEIGYDVLATVASRAAYCNVLKIGVYAEYGVLGVRSNTIDNQGILSFQRLNDTQLKLNDATINPYFVTSMKSSDRVFPFYVGLKITYMFGGSRTMRAGTWHRGCMCYN